MTKVLQSLTTFELLCGLNSFPVPSQQMTMFFGILGIWVCLLIAVVLLCCPGNTRAQGEENVKLPQKFGRVKPDCMVLSYHIRNVPVLSTIEMSPSFGFTLPRNRERVPWRKSLFSRDDSELEEGCDVGSGMGARGKGQRPFPRPAL